MRNHARSRHHLRLAVSSILMLAVCLASCSRKSGDDLVIYAYDSFVSEWGPGPKVMPLFEKATGIKASLVSRGDAGQTLAAAIEEKGRPQADIIIGIDQFLLPQADKADLLAAFRPEGLGDIDQSLVFDPKGRVVPYDYAHFAVIWDSQGLKNPPSSLEDLLKEEYRGKLILMDPRSSTPGLGFLAWTVSAYGSGWADYWKALRPSLLTIAAGWDSGYGLFTKGEAPLVLSYSTSPAYHAYAEGTERYKALLFSGGHPLQIEGAAILKGAKHRKNAEKFLSFMLSREFQGEIPLTNWMYPVRGDIELPEAYRSAAKPESIAAPDPGLFSQAQASWSDAVSK